MNDSNAFPDGTASGDEGPPYRWIDEWLCEYVDGTMDPSVEAVFEQYVEANPELKAHIERLRQTRELLCQCGASPAESTDPASHEPPDPDPPSPATTLSLYSLDALSLVSSVTVALAVGFLAGTLFVGTPAASTTTSPPSATRSSPAPTPPRTQRAPVPPLVLAPGSRPSAASLLPTDSLQIAWSPAGTRGP